MKDQRGFWYWFSLSNFGLMLGSILGWFGRDAQEGSQAALTDMKPLSPLLFGVGVLLLVILIRYGLYRLA